MSARDRPILFSAPMVLSILYGYRKGQTRRLAKLSDAGLVGRRGHQWHVDDPGATAACPYGAIGDRLWVRETWAHSIHAACSERDEDGPFVYAADGNREATIDGRWRPSIHMPRHASRISLEITDVRLQRLHDISESDAVAEGVSYSLDIDAGAWCGASDRLWGTAREAFRDLWESIHGNGSWAANPWVWALTFRRLP